MRPGRRSTVTSAQREELWRRFKAGEAVLWISRELGQPPTNLYRVPQAAGGIEPPPRTRSSRVLSLGEREEISRGIAAGDTFRAIAKSLNRAVSTVSQEVARHGGRGRYRAAQADRAAWVSARRPKPCLLIKNRQLQRIVAVKLKQDWFPQQIAGWLRDQYPGNPEMWVSHETIYRSLFVQARGALKKELMGHLRSRRSFRRPRHAIDVSKKLIGFVITIPLALLLRSYWALVIGMVAGNVLSVAVTYLLHPYRPRFSLTCAGEMLGFSKWLILSNAIQFLRTRSPDFIIGRISGPSALGLFSISYEISAVPISEIVAPINRVVFSGYSKLASDIPLLRQSYSDTLAVIAICALPAGFGISAVAVPLIELVFGQKWAGAAPLVSILAIFGGLHALHSNSGSVYNALGKPYLITLTGVCNIVVLLIASLVLVLQYGVIGIAAAYLGTSILLTPFNFFVLCREIRLGLTGLLSILWRPIVSSIFMYACASYTNIMLVSSIKTNLFVRLAILIVEGMLVYILALWSLWLVSGRGKTSAEYRLTLLLWKKARSTLVVRALRRSHPS